MFYVLAKSPYQKIEDLKGKHRLVDPNSTSGNNMPRFMLDKLGIEPDAFFAKTVFTGSHENAVLALAQGTVDVAANWWNAPDDSNLTRMLNKGMLKNANGSPMKKEDFRIILKSDLIINSPYAYLSDLPDDLKAAIRKAFLDAATKDKAAFDQLSDGKNRPWQPVTDADYDKTIELVNSSTACARRRADRATARRTASCARLPVAMPSAVVSSPIASSPPLTDAYRRAARASSCSFSLASARRCCC